MFVYLYSRVLHLYRLSALKVLFMCLSTCTAVFFMFVYLYSRVLHLYRLSALKVLFMCLSTCTAVFFMFVYLYSRVLHLYRLSALKVVFMCLSTCTAVFFIQLTCAGLTRAVGVLFVAIQKTYNSSASMVTVLGAVLSGCFSVTGTACTSAGGGRGHWGCC